MDNWITLHDGETVYYVNINNVRYMNPTVVDGVECTSISFVGGFIIVDEDLETIKRMIQNYMHFDFYNK